MTPAALSDTGPGKETYRNTVKRHLKSLHGAGRSSQPIHESDRPGGAMGQHLPGS